MNKKELTNEEVEGVSGGKHSLYLECKECGKSKFKSEITKNGGICNDCLNAKKVGTATAEPITGDLLEEFKNAFKKNK